MTAVHDPIRLTSRATTAQGGRVDVDVWLTELTERRGDRSILSDEERERADRFVNDRDRAWFVARRAAIRDILGQYVGRRPADIVFEPGRHGKPRVADGDGLEISWSHSRGAVALAVAKVPVGIDVERLDALPEVNRIASMLGVPADAARSARRVLEAWVRTEALVKVTGLGLAGFDEAVGVLAAGRERPGIPVRLGGSLVALTDLSLGGRIVGALATEVPSDGFGVAVHYRAWSGGRPPRAT